MATTVQQYLSQYPVDEKDIVHVEDGGWVNPDGDFGSPQSLQWNYPLQPNNAQVLLCNECSYVYSLIELLWDILKPNGTFIFSLQLLLLLFILEWLKPSFLKPFSH